MGLVVTSEMTGFHPVLGIQEEEKEVKTPWLVA